MTKPINAAELINRMRNERLNQIDLALGRKLRVLFVCGGNTCRSPMAAAISNFLHAELLEAESAGTAAWEPAANKKAVDVMCELFSVDISTHKPRRLSDLNLQAYDIVVALDHAVATELRDADLWGIVEEWDVRDPYGHPTSEYEATALALRDRINELVHGL